MARSSAGAEGAPPSVTTFPNASRFNDLMMIVVISVRSACSFHLCAIMGQIWVGVLSCIAIPNWLAWPQMPASPAGK